MKKLVNKKTLYIIPLTILVLIVAAVLNPEHSEKIFYLLPYALVYALVFFLIEKYFSYFDLQESKIVRKYLFFSKEISYNDIYSLQRLRSLLSDFISIVDVNGKVFKQNMEPYFTSGKEMEEFYLFLKSKNPKIKTNIDFSKPINVVRPPKEYFSEPK